MAVIMGGLPDGLYPNGSDLLANSEVQIDIDALVAALNKDVDGRNKFGHDGELKC
jgi:hypothetical protein